jgi:hypothetical protein
MNINELFLQLKDIQFQADKLIKQDWLDKRSVASFAEYTNKLKFAMHEMGLAEDLNNHLNLLSPVDAEFDPKLSVLTQVGGVLTLGFSKKRAKRKRTQAYFKTSIRETKDRFTYIDLRLREI